MAIGQELHSNTNLEYLNATDTTHARTYEAQGQLSNTRLRPGSKEFSWLAGSFCGANCITLNRAHYQAVRSIRRTPLTHGTSL